MSRADAGRIIHIAKRRERTKEDIKNQRLRLEDEKKNLAASIASKFTTNVDLVEEKIKAATVGLATLEEIKEKQNEILQQANDIITGKDELIRAVKKEKSKPLTFDNRTVQKRILSFNIDDNDDDNDDDDDDDDDDEEKGYPILKKRIGMDPTVDTFFLPDLEREQELIRKKEALAAEWLQLQEKEKNEEINIAFCYWDGSSHRKDIKMKKGATISQFLQRALEILRKEFCELKLAATENLMFVKEDLIIPHFYTFQDFIATKAMGKTGPLWQFDAVGEIRVRQDAALDTGEAHPVKIVLRSWFEKNKHIYPASRWEAFTPNKEYRKQIDDLSTI